MGLAPHRFDATSNFHEYCLPVRVERTLGKWFARLAHWRGAELDLTLSDLPKLSRVDVAREALSRIAPNASLRILCGTVSDLLETFHAALFTHELSERDKNLREVERKLKTLPEAQIALKRLYHERHEMYLSESRIEGARSHLERAVIYINLALCGTGYPFMGSKADIRQNLELVYRNILDADERLRTESRS